MEFVIEHLSKRFRAERGFKRILIFTFQEGKIYGLHGAKRRGEKIHA